MAAAQQFACSLATVIVKEQYGELAAGLISTLLTRGRSSFHELIRATQLQPSLLKQVLLSLTQQNCILVYLQPSEVFVSGTRPASHLYEAHLEGILQGLRRPKCLQYVKAELATLATGTANGGPGVSATAPAEAATAIMELLLEHGRLRLDQIVPAVVTRLSQDVAAAAEAAEEEGGQGEGPGALNEGAVRRAFVHLVRERYIERAPPCNLAPPVPEVMGQKKKSVPKAGTAQYAKMQSEALRKLSVRRYEDQRFRVPREVLLDMAGGLENGSAEAAADIAAVADDAVLGNGELAGGLAGKRDMSPAAAAAAAAAAAVIPPPAAMPQGKKRKKAGGAAAAAAVADASAVGGREAGLEAPKRRKVAQEDDKAAPKAGPAGPAAAAAAGASTTPELQDSQILWRINPEEFNRRFRHQVCISLVRSKLGADAAAVLAAMLEHSRRFETKLQEDSSVGMGLQDVEASLARAQAEGRLDQLAGGSSVQQIMEDLATDSLEAVLVAGPGPSGTSYMVNLLGLLEKARLQQLEAVIRDMFGVAGLRVFLLLMNRGYLEQKQIAEYSMQQQKETRETLYRMLRAGFVVLQDIPRSADRAPSRSFYIWGANLQSAFKHLAGDLYRATLNVYLRLNHEMGQHQELLALVESAQEAGALNFNMTEGQRRALERLQRSCSVLEASLLNMDDMRALFNEY